MADGIITQTPQQTPSDWEAAFNARFEAMWEQFWAKLAHKHRLPQPLNLGKKPRTPTARQPARAIHPEQHSTGTSIQATHQQQAIAPERHAPTAAHQSPDKHRGLGNTPVRRKKREEQTPTSQAYWHSKVDESTRLAIPSTPTRLRTAARSTRPGTCTQTSREASSSGCSQLELYSRKTGDSYCTECL
ncbi:Hypothetical predicted protein [Pelobates cultripes]|uniref:Uncharacterized protein n=1 Tax=Pelobates cultripes TaxID=61616 RepID=A0AAD1WZP1_PELCU|nr:Hypothetical predicted protein [Pelobates cultripes]